MTLLIEKLQRNKKTVKQEDYWLRGVEGGVSAAIFGSSGVSNPHIKAILS